jgi:hypothetical protein
MPARRRTLRVAKRVRKPIHRKLILLSLIVLLTLITVVFLRGERWDKTSRISVISQTDDEIIISTFDPISDSVTKLVIPAITEVKVARGYGIMRIKNVNNLGKSEGIGDILLAETVTRYFKFPLYYWTSSTGLGLSEKNLINVINAVLVPYPSNLSLPLKIQLAFFNLKVKDSLRETIHLADTSFLDQKPLKDGQTGYVVTSVTPNKVALLFTDEYITKNQVAASIIDATDTPGVAEDVGRVLEAMGAKTAAIQKQDGNDFDCTVASEDRIIKEKIARLLGCEIDLTESNFNLVVSLGKQFAERY